MVRNYDNEGGKFMELKIEKVDDERMKLLKWYLVGFVISLVLMLTRHFFRSGGYNSQPIGTAVLVCLILSLLLQVISLIKSTLLAREIQKTPGLEEALNNELVKSIVTKSWIAAYIGASAMTLFFAISGFFYPICDPFTISLTSIIAGASASRCYFYFGYKKL